VRSTRAAHDNGEDVDFGTWLVLRMAFARGVYLARINWAVWERWLSLAPPLCNANL
jgi:hypothetical protein